MTDYDYDNRGNRTAETPQRGRSTTYTHDQANRLTAVSEGALVADLSAGWFHSAAVHEDGTVWGWGQNTYGQLGDGTTTSATEPRRVPVLDDIGRVTAGAYHTVAVSDRGEVWAFGSNSVGQLGDNTTTDRATPVQVAGLAGIIDADGGYAHNLAVDAEGRVWAWGWNAYGQLGDTTTTTRTTPVLISGLADVVAVNASYGTSYAVHADGTVSAWGLNNTGQLGDATTTSRSTPQTITALNDITELTAGEGHAVAVHRDGTISAWGDNTYNQLGDASTASTTSPQPVPGLAAVAQVNAGSYHTMAITDTGDTVGWGLSFTGQLGTGSAAIHSTPTTVAALQGATSLGLGFAHTIATTADGSVLATGLNDNGQLGDATTTNAFAPVAAAGAFDLADNEPLDVTYAYGPDSQRTTKTRPGSPDTGYVWSQAGEMPLLLTETDGTTDTHIIYGPGATPIAEITADTAVWYHHDQLGSTRLVTDQAGNPLGTYTYDPYGALTDSTGTFDPLLDYASQYTDNETGHQYLRARYYDPDTAQFLTRDPLVAVTREPYGYTGNNPINRTDPTGMDWWDPRDNVLPALGEAAQDTGEAVWRNRGTIATIGAAGACLVPGWGLAACGYAAAGAFGVRAEQRVDEQGFSSSLRANVLDGGLTYLTFGLGGGFEQLVGPWAGFVRYGNTVGALGRANWGYFGRLIPAGYDITNLFGWLDEQC